MAVNMLDRISNLPDEILCHILYFLPTQETVATSVLSKRWRNLWTSVPVLDYDDQIYLRNRKLHSFFERLVYTTILAKDGPIRRFRLKYGVSGFTLSDANVSNTHVNDWVNTVIRRGVENLNIEMSCPNYIISLNCCIFRCKTLVGLKLKSLSLNVSSVVLPSLKSLHLFSVKFTRRQNLIELLSGCPILEDLKVHDINYGRKGSFCKEEFKGLTKLVRADLLHFVTDIPLKAICNVEVLSITKFNQLEKVVREFPNLRHVVLNFVSWNWALEMIKNCPNLQIFEVVAGGGSFFPDPHFVPECLTSRFRKCSLKYFHGTFSELRFAKYIMQNSTILRTMTICSNPSLPPHEKHDILTELATCPRRSALCELSFQ